MGIGRCGREGVLLREPRATKSFRDAGDRIVRQESAVSPAISGLLSAPALAPRGAITDADAWDVRLAALATLGQYDGLTFVTVGHSRVAAPYNLVDETMSDPAIRAAVDQAANSATTRQVRASVSLADGRMTSAVLVTPLAPSEAFVGALVAFRVGRPFAAVDTYTAVGIAEIVSLELARSLTAEREATERRQAFALYELARHGLFGEDLDESLQGIAMLLATTLDHEAAHIWLRRPDRSLRRHAAYPSDPLASETLWENQHSALSGALHERRLVRMSSANSAWIPSNTGEVLVVPLRGDPRPVGILVLARSQPPYGVDDIEMADVLGTFIGQVVASAARRPAASSRSAPAPAPMNDRESEVELAERI
jgi:GTP-sensing pleiotropic transcriptional regulator CodY